MLVDLSFFNGEVSFYLKWEPPDRRHIQRSDRSRYGRTREVDENQEYDYVANHDIVSFRNSLYHSKMSLHPDLAGLASILIALPFAKERIQLTSPVSRRFGESASKITGREVGPIDDKVVPRVPEGYEKKVGLLFSGGVDSMAAVHLLPEGSELFYLERDPMGLPVDLGAYNPELAHRACDYQERQGRVVHRSRSNLECILSPVSFPTHQAVSVPGVLAADERSLQALGFGTVLEPAYGIHRGKFKELAPGSSYNSLRSLHDAAGLRYYPMTTLLSEVLTSDIVSSMGEEDLAVSCPRPMNGAPCMRCVKCFRKELLKYALRGKRVDGKILDAFIDSPMIQKALSTYPISLRNVYAWLLPRIDSEHPLLGLMRKYFRGSLDSCSWVSRYYADGLKNLPVEYHGHLKSLLSERFDPMEDEDIAMMKLFHETAPTERDHEEFVRGLKTITKKWKAKG